MARGRKPGIKALLRQPRAAAPARPKPQVGKKQQLSGSLAEAQKQKLARIQEQLCGAEMSSMARFSADDDNQMAEEQPFDRELKDDLSGLKASNRAFGRHLKSAIAMSDVVVEVLDARDPMGFRSKALEEAVLERGKKLVLLLNKIDLLPDMAIVERWERVLKRDAPVVIFRAMTTSSRSRQATVKFEKGKATSACKKQLKSGYSPLGASDLMSVLSNYTRVSATEVEADAPAVSDGHRSITVSVVGMPNVGKSSVINSLMRNTKCLKTGNVPGVTREAQTIKLTKNIRLVDTPGVVFDSDVTLVQQVLRGTFLDTNDVLIHEAVKHLLEHPRKREALCKYFGLAGDMMGPPPVEQFLADICDSRMLVLGGGRRDLTRATQVVIHAWVNGMVDYYELPITAGSTGGKVEYVAAPSKELDLDNL